MSPTQGGGRPIVKELPYSTPQGPTTQMHEGPGLDGSNYGNAQKPVCNDSPSGSPGIGGSVSRSGSQK